VQQGQEDGQEEDGQEDGEHEELDDDGGGDSGDESETVKADGDEHHTSIFDAAKVNADMGESDHATTDGGTTDIAVPASTDVVPASIDSQIAVTQGEDDPESTAENSWIFSLADGGPGHATIPSIDVDVSGAHSDDDDDDDDEFYDSPGGPDGSDAFSVP